MKTRNMVLSASVGAWMFGCAEPTGTREIIDNLTSAGFPSGASVIG
jgi:hypothetical protein